MGDAAGLVLAHQQLLGGIVLVDGGVEGVVLVGEEGVGGEVVVAVADVGVVQQVCDGEDGIDVVLLGIGVDLQRDAGDILQEEVHLLLDAHHNIDALDARLLELANLTLDEGLAVLLVQTLGHGVDALCGDIGAAGGQDEGVLHPTGFQLLPGELGHFQVIQITLALESGDEGEHFLGRGEHRIVQVLIQVGKEGAGGIALEQHQVFDDLKFFISYHETYLLMSVLAGFPQFFCQQVAFKKE